ncbi:MAG: hypothetical protein OHK0046_45500 [Anaerolineae bacterium]
MVSHLNTRLVIYTDMRNKVGEMTTAQTFRNTVVILLTLLLAYVLIISRQIIMVLLIAIIIASAIRPLVVSLHRRRIPMGLSIFMVYFAIAMLAFILLVAVMPPVVNQVVLILENDARLAFRIIQAQRWIERVIFDVTNNEVSLVATDDIRAAVTDFVEELRDAAPSLIDDLGSTLGEAVLIFVMGAYWLTSHRKVIVYAKQLAPLQYRHNVEEVIEEIEETMGAYVRGIALVSLIVGLLNFVPMQLIGVPNALTLGFIIGLTTAVPMIGGLLGGVLAVLITLVSSSEPYFILAVAVIAFGVQQIESYYLSPRILSDNVGLDPLLVIVYTAIGFILFGVTGALIAVPVMGTIHLLLLYLVVEPYRESLRQVGTDEEGLPIIQGEPSYRDQDETLSHDAPI